VYRAKRDALLAALGREFADWPEVRWTQPAGGLYVWLTFPETIDTGPSGPLMQAALRRGVLFVPGEFGHVSEEGPVPACEARLSFGVAAPDDLAEGVRRLRLAVGDAAGGLQRRGIVVPGLEDSPGALLRSPSGLDEGSVLEPLAGD
jgi:2-aminoadipate transaminase